MIEVHAQSRPREGDSIAARADAPDRLARTLELGLAAFVMLVPLPFGAVPAGGRLAFEIGAFALLLLWAIRAYWRPTRLPSTPILVGLAGMLSLALLQAAPIGVAAISRLSPNALDGRTKSIPDANVLRTEEKFLGVNPIELETAATLSVDPVATASALRTGAAYAAVLIVACAVAATRGVRRLAIALLVGASLQGLYGVLVLASEDPHIWHLSKKFYLLSATGTFVNKNHFACLLAMSMSAGLAVILDSAGRTRHTLIRSHLLHMFSRENSQNLVLGVLWVVALAGLLTSFSRAGIALGVLAMVFTVVSASKLRRSRPSKTVLLLVVAAATVPLLQIGSGRLVNRFGDTSDDLLVPGGRLTVWKDTLSMAREFPLVGSGYGTFAYAYPAYRTPDVRAFYAHAHQDLLQALAEGGAVGSLFLLLVLIPTLRNVVFSLTGAKGTIAIGIAAALSAVFLHSLVDFDFHIPANGAIAASLVGALEGLPWTNPTSSS